MRRSAWPEACETALCSSPLAFSLADIAARWVSAFHCPRPKFTGVSFSSLSSNVAYTESSWSSATLTKDSRPRDRRRSPESPSNAASSTWLRTRCSTPPKSQCGNKSPTTSGTSSPPEMPTTPTKNSVASSNVTPLRPTLDGHRTEAGRLGRSKHPRRSDDLRHPRRTPQTAPHDQHARKTKQRTQTPHSSCLAIPQRSITAQTRHCRSRRTQRRMGNRNEISHIPKLET
jgi:hypothetical protein